jgi:hypothetical protein
MLNLKDTSGRACTARICLALTLWLLLGGAFAEDYSLNWTTIDGGGGTSTGGVYSVSGTIGQPDAGTMSGGGYSLTGGFWGIVAAVQNPPAPLLTVTRSNTTVVVAWPGPEAGWKLQATTAVLPGGSVWTEIPPPYRTNGPSLFYFEAPPLGNKFYRLHKP